MHDLKAHELDDGSPEVVDLRPARRGPSATSIESVVRGSPNPNMDAFRALGDDARREFILIRSQRGAAKIALSHAPTLAALIRLWMAKRADFADDPGATIAELTESSGLPDKTLRAVLTTLVRSGVVISKSSYSGWQGRRALYYPTDLGVQALAIAETIGYGSMVQVGRGSSAWQARNSGEPPNLFQFASLIGRTAAPESLIEEPY